VRIICKVEFGLSCIMVHGEEDVDDELCFFFWHCIPRGWMRKVECLKAMGPG
jgi:hypothetical protein